MHRTLAITFLFLFLFLFCFILFPVSLVVTYSCTSLTCYKRSHLKNNSGISFVIPKTMLYSIIFFSIFSIFYLSLSFFLSISSSLSHISYLFSSFCTGKSFRRIFYPFRFIFRSLFRSKSDQTSIKFLSDQGS